MFRLRGALVVGACVSALAAASAVPATAESSTGAPKATEIGVSPTEIHIAVIADVDNPFAPGLFKGAVNGVQAAAKYINSKAGGGGIAGRKLVVDFIDSHLNANDSRNGVITVCQQDYAMVGNFMLFLSNVDDEVNCKDQAGATTGIPDLASVATGVPQSCSPVAFPVSPPQLDLQHEGPEPADLQREPVRQQVLPEAAQARPPRGHALRERHEGRSAWRRSAHRHRYARRGSRRTRPSASPAVLRRAPTRRSSTR